MRGGEDGMKPVGNASNLRPGYLPSLDTWSSPTYVMTVMTVLFFIGLVWPATRLFASPVDYLAPHIVLEFLPMTVSAMIFALAWNLNRQGDNKHRMMLGAGFLAVCLVDVGHVLSYPGMPVMFTPSGAEKALIFWLAARYIAAGVILAIALSAPGHWTPAVCRGVVAAGVALAAVIWWMTIGHPEWFPRTFVEGQGLTTFKIGAEYLVSAIYGLGAILLLRKARHASTDDLQWLGAAAWTMALAELLFASYGELTDAINLLGHVYKATAYIMIYRAVFAAGVQRPYLELKAAEESIRNINAELEVTLQTIPDVLFRMNRQGICLGIWTQNSDLLAARKSVFLGRAVADVMPVEAAATIMSAIADADATGCSYGKILCLEGPDGKRWFELSVSKKASSDPDASFAVLSRDITERRSAEVAMRANEEFYKAIADNGRALIWMAGPDRELEYFNRPWLEFTGRDLEQELDNGMAYGIHPDDYDDALKAFDTAFSKREAFSLVSRLRRHDGVYRWMITEGTPRYGSSGEYLGHVGHCLDATDIKVAEEELSRHRCHLEELVKERTAELEDSNSRLNAMFSLSPDGFVALSAEGCVKFVNPAFLAMTGMAIGELVGKLESDLDEALQSRSDEAGVFAGVSSYFENPVSASTNQPFVLRIPRHAVIQVVGVRGESQSISRILYFRDVTRESEVDRMKSEFLSHAAHELRTPMASILGFSELLLVMEYDEATRRDMLDTIHRQTKWLVDIINELLDLSRIEARRGKDLRLGDVELTALVRATTNSLAMDAERWPIVIDVPSHEMHVVTDPAKLSQALTNVLGNAQKYSPDGGEIQISILEVLGRTGIKVTDHGIGMTPDQVARLGERFYRANNSGKIPGTGLGITIVKEILKLLGGSFEVMSEKDSGTTIILWLAGSKPEAEKATNPPTGNKRETLQ